MARHIPYQMVARRWLPVLFFCVLAMVLPGSALAGDYILWVADGPVPDCLPPVAGHGNWNEPVDSGSEVAADVMRYFRGEKPHIRTLQAAFANAHVQFCGHQERLTVYRAFVTAAKLPHLAHEGDLYDYAYMLGGAELLPMISRAREEPGLTPRESKRLDRLLAATMKGIAARRRAH